MEGKTFYKRKTKKPSKITKKRNEHGHITLKIKTHKNMKKIFNERRGSTMKWRNQYGRPTMTIVLPHKTHGISKTITKTSKLYRLLRTNLKSIIRNYNEAIENADYQTELGYYALGSILKEELQKVYPAEEDQEPIDYLYFFYRNLESIKNDTELIEVFSDVYADVIDNLTDKIIISYIEKFKKEKKAKVHAPNAAMNALAELFSSKATVMNNSAKAPETNILSKFHSQIDDLSSFMGAMTLTKP